MQRAESSQDLLSSSTEQMTSSLYFRIEGSVSVGSTERPAYLAFDLENYTEVKFNYVFREVCGKRSEPF